MEMRTLLIRKSKSEATSDSSSSSNIVLPLSEAQSDMIYDKFQTNECSVCCRCIFVLLILFYKIVNKIITSELNFINSVGLPKIYVNLYSCSIFGYCLSQQSE